MKTYLTYKNQVQGFEDVSETVKAIEKIAASSVHFLKMEVFNLNEYQKHIEEILAGLSLSYFKKDHPLLQKNKAESKALIVITGDKGLVGGLWHTIVNSFLNKADDYQSTIAIGNKGKNYLEEEGIKIIKSGEINSIMNYVFDEFKREKFSEIDILYPKFVSLAEQKPAFVPFLPFKFILPEAKSSSKNASGLPIFEPSKQKLFNQLLQKYIGLYLRKIVLETKLSELSARTVAMEHASAKTDEFIENLTLSFRKERCRILTQRQLESFAAHRVRLGP